MKITEGWMNHKGGKFSADMSDVEMHAKDTGKGIHCPGCKKTLKISDFTPQKDRENDITHWKHNCKECNAALTIFNESSKPTFKQFLLRESKGNAFQVRVGSGDWEDTKLYFDDLQDIVDRVNHPLHGTGKTDLGALTTLVQAYIGDGPDGPGTSWDEIDYDVKSMSDDVLKISYTFSGVNMRLKSGKYGTPVKRSGVITIMPGVVTEGIELAEPDAAEESIGWYIVREKDDKCLWGPFKTHFGAQSDLKNHSAYKTYGVPADKLVYIEHGWCGDQNEFTPLETQ